METAVQSVEVARLKQPCLVRHVWLAALLTKSVNAKQVTMEKIVLYALPAVLTLPRLAPLVLKEARLTPHSVPARQGFMAAE